MRESVAAVALINDTRSSRTLYLAQWNPHWSAYNFISGHKRPRESFRECIIREVSEELGLITKAEFSASAKPLIHLEYTAWSKSAAEETFYIIELFDVRLITGASLRKVGSDPLNRWLSEAEIHNQKCQDGRAISPTMHLLLSRVGLI